VFDLARQTTRRRFQHVPVVLPDIAVGDDVQFRVFHFDGEALFVGVRVGELVFKKHRLAKRRMNGVFGRDVLW